MSILDFTKNELDLIGMTEDSGEMNADMRKHILHMVDEFSKEGHSGFSASYAIGILQKVLNFEPLSPLTGEDDEWCKHDYGNEITYQNIRCSHVFKDSDGQAYDINGKVFTEHYYDDEGVEQTCSYTSYESRVNVEFPYTPKTEYVDVGFRMGDGDDEHE